MENFDDSKKELSEVNFLESTHIEIIKTVIAERERLGISQRQLSKLSGVPQKTISRIENLKDMPRLDTLIKIIIPLNLKLILVEIDEKKQKTTKLTLSSSDNVEKIANNKVKSSSNNSSINIQISK